MNDIFTHESRHTHTQKRIPQISIDANAVRRTGCAMPPTDKVSLQILADIIIIIMAAVEIPQIILYRRQALIDKLYDDLATQFNSILKLYPVLRF